MAVVVKDNGSEFIPAPEGLHQGVCVDVVDLGEIDSGLYGKQHKIQIVWQLDARMPNGKPFMVQKRYTASLHEKANLSKDLESWRGRRFTPEERKGFDVEKLIDANAQLVIVHNNKNGNTWANVNSVIPIKANMPKMLGAGYTRVKDRPGTQQGNHEYEEPATAYEGADDDIPF